MIVRKARQFRMRGKPRLHREHRMDRRLLTFALLLTSLLFLSCRPNTTTVRGTVTIDGKPAPNIEVRFGPNMGEAVTETNYDGRFTITATHKPAEKLELKALKVGYIHDKIEFPAYSGSGVREYNIELKRLFEPTARP